jgi:hypothetical protein
MGQFKHFLNLLSPKDSGGHVIMQLLLTKFDKYESALH